MQLTLTLLQLLPIQTGTGKNVDWRKQDIIGETQEQYPKKICISLWGDTIDSVRLAVGQVLKIDFDIESREYNGRWYTSVKAWKIELAESPQSTYKTTTSSPSSSGTQPWDEKNGNAGLKDNEVLPF